MSYLLHSFILSERLTLVVSPQPGSGGSNATCDGRVGRQGVSESFTAIRSGSGTANNEAESILTLILLASATTGQYQTLRRIGMTFDTGSIPSYATVLAVTLRLRGYDKRSDLGTCDLVICEFAPAANNDFVNADYALSAWGAQLARVSYGAWSTTGYNEIALPTTAVTKGGITRIGARLGWDYDNSTSGLTWSANLVTGYYWRAADYGSDQPQLVVEYET